MICSYLANKNVEKTMVEREDSENSYGDGPTRKELQMWQVQQ